MLKEKSIIDKAKEFTTLDTIKTLLGKKTINAPTVRKVKLFMDIHGLELTHLSIHPFTSYVNFKWNKFDLAMILCPQPYPSDKERYLMVRCTLKCNTCNKKISCSMNNFKGKERVEKILKNPHHGYSTDFECDTIDMEDMYGK